jgi:hypothetical protein
MASEIPTEYWTGNLTSSHIPFQYRMISNDVSGPTFKAISQQ